MNTFNGIISGALRGVRLQPDDALALASCDDLELLSAAAGRLRDQGHGPRVSYSPKVFIPLTHLCRDVCHYCTFARTPKKLDAPYLSPDQVLAIARAGVEAGANDMGGTLMNESISRAAGASHGQEVLPAEMEALIRSIGRTPAQRTNGYDPVWHEAATAQAN